MQNALTIQRVANAKRTTLRSVLLTGAIGDVLRLEAVVTPGTVALTCYQNGVQPLQTTDNSPAFTSGSPGVVLYGNVAALGNWSGGNLHPIAQLDMEQDWTRVQRLRANAGTCAMSAGTTCKVTLVERPSTPDVPRCIATVQGSAAIAAACKVSGATATVTAATVNSATWTVFIF